MEHYVLLGITEQVQFNKTGTVTSLWLHKRYVREYFTEFIYFFRIIDSIIMCECMMSGNIYMYLSHRLYNSQQSVTALNLIIFLLSHHVKMC